MMNKAMAALVLKHLDLVRRLAGQMMRRMPSSVEMDDLIQNGMVGLLEAVARYQPRSDSTFATYATQRIRGAMLDSLRRSDRGTRALRRELRAIADARQCIETRTCAAAKAGAIAGSLGMTLEHYFRALQAGNQAVQISMEAREWADGRPSLPEALEQDESARAIAAAIGALPPQERRILLLYYGRELLMRDIGIRLAVSESRICQIHKRSIKRVRAALQC
jgi:RNA polymerase sigma factor FliA